ncbi:hypothetical protein WDH52_03655 [Streptomyces sp. TRM70308]
MSAVRAVRRVRDRVCAYAGPLLILAVGFGLGALATAALAELATT